MPILSSEAETHFPQIAQAQFARLYLKEAVCSSPSTCSVKPKYNTAQIGKTNLFEILICQCIMALLVAKLSS